MRSKGTRKTLFSWFPKGNPQNNRGQNNTIVKKLGNISTPACLEVIPLFIKHQKIHTWHTRQSPSASPKARTWRQPGRTRPTTSSPLSLPPSPSMSPSPTMLLLAGVRGLIAASLFHTLHNCQVSSAFYPTRLVSISPIHFWEVTFAQSLVGFRSIWVSVSQSLQNHSHTSHSLELFSCTRPRGSSSTGGRPVFSLSLHRRSARSMESSAIRSYDDAQICGEPAQHNRSSQIVSQSCTKYWMNAVFGTLSFLLFKKIRKQPCRYLIEYPSHLILVAQINLFKLLVHWFPERSNWITHSLMEEEAPWNRTQDSSGTKHQSPRRQKLQYMNNLFLRCKTCQTVWASFW